MRSTIHAKCGTLTIAGMIGDGTLIGSAATRKLVPYGAGASWIKFKVADVRFTQFEKLHFQYKTGTGLQNYHMLIDNISITPIQ